MKSNKQHLRKDDLVWRTGIFPSQQSVSINADKVVIHFGSGNVSGHDSPEIADDKDQCLRQWCIEKAIQNPHRCRGLATEAQEIYDWVTEKSSCTNKMSPNVPGINKNCIHGHFVIEKDNLKLFYAIKFE